jgi:hypothetical protein
MNKLALKIGVGLVLLFILGVSTGMVVARQTNATCRGGVPSKNFEDRWIATRIAECTTQLNLTPEQIAAIHPHFDKLASDMRGFRAELRAKVYGAFKEMNTGIARELTPAQRELFWGLLREKTEKSANKRNAPASQ